MNAVKQEENLGFTIENDKLHFESKEGIKNFIDRTDEMDFNAQVRKLQSRGFRPLTPVFKETETEAYNKFLMRKQERLHEKGQLYSSKNTDDELSVPEELDEDDELIADPAFAALLNEDRAIYVGDELYVFTTEGAYFCKIEHEQKLYDYLKKRGKALKNKMVAKELPCDAYLKGESSTESREMVTRISEDISLYAACGGGGGGYYPPVTSPDPVPAKLPYQIKQNLGYCTIRSESVWQNIFGDAETCHDYFDSKRRVKVKFWNQNYAGLYSSIGVMTKFQKKYWLGWQKSDAVDYTEMGVNYAEYTYSFNVPMDDPTKDFGIIAKYKGVTYKTDGTTVQDYPVSTPNWPFRSEDNYPLNLELYLFDKKFEGIKGSELNKAIRDLIMDQLKSKINGLEKAFQDEKVSIKATIVDPFKNEARFVIINKVKQSSGGKIRTTFDQNFLLTFKWKDKVIVNDNGEAEYTDSWSSKVFGAKSYKNVNIDFYGVARRDGNKYRGKQMGYGK
ncbi:hypothetical protein [Sinomicrobium weinanense]|uniref:Uncharacterized protein n=1 Tax=Sinomicrobium weinanense TaxID=2842200 RepID=A0A926Q0U8_9FLAO|nr:hypothetical protein [Sinomicrobium weinanense]MBC9795098.1 hypothetical protein [Sinomicrobium weinanense]MBU3123771.1 hypothetical protein [Sinomicrobium weinanense]